MAGLVGLASFLALLVAVGAFATFMNRRAASRVSRIAHMDPAIEAGTWGWNWTPGAAVAFRDDRPAAAKKPAER
jgi:hypothetical protein